MASYYRGDPGDLFGCIIDVVDPAPAWFAQAQCRGNTSDFFVDKGQSVAPAKAICAGCPVVDECLSHAIAHRETRGVWGGLTPIERKRLRLG